MARPRAVAPPAPPSPAGIARARWRDALSDERMAHLVKTVFRGTSRALQRRLARHDVQYGQWTLLRVLWQADGVTQRELAELAGVAESSAFVALARMEQQGYVKRGKLPGNNKLVRVFLTPAGAGLRASSVAAAEAVNRIALRGVSAEDVAATRRTLIAMIENLDAEQAGGLVDDDGEAAAGTPARAA